METHLSLPSRFTSKVPTVPIASFFPHYKSFLLSKANLFTCASDPFFACNKNLQLQRSFSQSFHFCFFLQQLCFLCIVTLSSLTLCLLCIFLCPVCLFIFPYSPDTLIHSFQLKIHSQLQRISVSIRSNFRASTMAHLHFFHQVMSDC